MAASIASLLLNNPGHHISVHVINEGLSPTAHDVLSRLTLIHGAKLHLHVVDAGQQSAMARVPIMKRLSKSVYYRFLVPYMLQSSVERVLFLDADTIVTGSLNELFEFDLEGACIGAVNDPLSSLLARERNLKGAYFNAGVMVIDLQSWRDLDVSHRALQLLDSDREKRRLNLYDQDALNIVLEGRWAALPGNFNHLVAAQFIGTFQQRHTRKPDRTGIVHFSGTCKPWDADYPLRAGHLYHDALAAAGWPSTNSRDASIANRIASFRRYLLCCFGNALRTIRNYWRLFRISVTSRRRC